MKTNLKNLRKSFKLTQSALQKETGIDQSLLSKFENELRVPSVEALIILADFYKVSIDYLLCRTENPYMNE